MPEAPPATLPTARYARPRALWLRRAKLGSAYARDRYGKYRTSSAPKLATSPPT
jgi:hypothetical protein